MNVINDTPNTWGIKWALAQNAGLEHRTYHVVLNHVFIYFEFQWSVIA